MGLNQPSMQVFNMNGRSESAETTCRRQPWYEAYMAALFETNQKQIAKHIRNAEQLILDRERELLAERNDLTEQRALNNALQALHALASCMKG